jgi:hypothetical protein
VAQRFTAAKNTLFSVPALAAEVTPPLVLIIDRDSAPLVKDRLLFAII